MYQILLNYRGLKILLNYEGAQTGIKQRYKGASTCKQRDVWAPPQASKTSEIKRKNPQNVPLRTVPNYQNTGL